MASARKRSLPRPHALEKVTRFDLQRFLKVDPRQEDVPRPVQDLVTCRLVEVHPLSYLRHAVHPLVVYCDLVLVHVVVHHHLAAADDRYFAHLAGV